MIFKNVGGVLNEKKKSFHVFFAGGGGGVVVKNKKNLISCFVRVARSRVT